MADNSIQDTMLAEIEPILRAARLRARQERLLFLMPWIIAICTLLIYVWCAFQIFNPGTVGTAREAILLAGYVCLGLSSVAWFTPVSHTGVCRRIDSAANLPDSTLTLWESHALPSGFWCEHAIRDNLDRLLAADWRTGWSVRPSPYLLPSFCTLMATMVLMVLASRVEPHFTGLPALTDDEREQVSNMQQQFDDWQDIAPPGVDREEWRELQEQVKGFDGPLSREDATRKDVLVELSKIEDKLAAMKESMDQKSVAAKAEPLAEALDSLDQLKEAASALREGDYQKAGEALEKAAQQWKMEKPENRDEQTLKQAAKKMEEAARKMEQRGMQESAKAAQQSAEGMRNNNGQQAAEGMERLGQSLKSQGKQQQQGQQQLDGMGEQAGGMKQGFGKNKSKSKGIGKGESDEGEESEQAGTGKGKDPFGERTSLEAQIKRERLMGELGQGQSQITTKKAESGTGVVSPEERGTGFDVYEKLSHEAIQDESIPMTHRESIRKYFESIRPQSTEQ